MGRPHRVLYAGAYYHVTTRGNRRQAVFLDDIDRRDWFDRSRVLALFGRNEATAIERYRAFVNEAAEAPPWKLAPISRCRRDAAIIRAHRAGNSPAVIAANVGVSLSIVRRVIRASRVHEVPGTS